MAADKALRCRETQGGCHGAEEERPHKGDYGQQQIRPLRICSGQQLRDRSELNRWMQPP